MAWYKDPQLYISRETPGLKLYRMKEPIGTPIALSGWVVYQMASNYYHLTWAREPLNSPFYRLPGINTPETELLAQKEALDRRVSILEAEISPLKVVVRMSKENRNTLIREKQALERIVSDLKARNSTLEDDKLKLMNDLNEIKAENRVEKRLSDLEATVSTLREFMRSCDGKNTFVNELDDEKAEIKAEQVSVLTSKLKDCCGAGGRSADEEPWKSGY
ncbi:uncharacterized protein LOC113337497 isoform X2 [Papaver somniferum]|uniref:uncharacterized protein LOC113337497 isoform X2 n=1 Tax=Papaver somniferum TaxID=3469 RepID=UPI000E6FC0BE|nr:uncharacterized protein LOC113337497 isoform X2 [Papaver somniferum]